MTQTFFIFAGWLFMVLVSVTVGSNMARARKRDADGWTLLSAFLGPLALLLLYFLGQAPPPTPEQRAASAKAGALLSAGIMLALALTLAIPFFKACFRL